MTVSKVLRNEGRISSTTRERVLRRVAELGYRPNFTARGLVSGRSFLIGLVVPDLMHPFFSAMAKAISRTLRAQGYGLAIANSEEDPEIETHEVATFLARGIDALVLASSQRSAAAKSFAQIEAAEVPYILVDRMIPGLEAHFVGSDDEMIGTLATEHLLERGYRRIAHIRRVGISTGAKRFRAYQATLKRHGRPVLSELVADAESSDERGEQCGFSAMQKLLSQKKRPDAVFCYNDVIAYGALKAIFEAGLRIPADLAVIGVSNLASLSFWDASPVALTTIDQGIRALADSTAQLVLDLIEGRSRPRSEHILLPPELVVRAST